MIRLKSLFFPFHLLNEPTTAIVYKFKKNLTNEKN
jgi:hypothetical protein